MMLRQIISSLESELENQGLLRSQRNFTLESLPSTTSNQAFTIGDLSVIPQYHPGQRVHYNRIELTLLVLCNVYGPHNSSATASEGYLAALDVFEAVENVIMARQQTSAGEEIQVLSATVQPLYQGGEEEYLVWNIKLRIETSRTLN